MPGDVVLPKAKIFLHGNLKRKYGGPYEWGVTTPMEAIRALDRMKPGFRDILRDGDWMLVRGPRHGGIDIDLPMMDFKLGDGGSLHIIPAAHGRGGRGTGKIIAGVALVALAVVAPYAAGAGVAAFGTTAAGATTVLGVSASSIGMMGVGMIFSGAASLLSPQPKTSRPTEREATAATPSFMFDGPGVVMEQGRIVPVIYGNKVRTGGVLIASSYDTIDVDQAGNAINAPEGVDGNWVWSNSKGIVL